MNAKELAEILNGRQYRKEITNEECKQAKESGLVVVFGGSDDLIYFSGAEADELGAYEGGTFYFTSDGLLRNECEDERCPYAEKMAEKALELTALWDQDGYSWIYETSIPHFIFDILEDEDKYCRGIVFALADVVSAAV